MKKILLLVVLVTLFLGGVAFADRNTATVITYSTSQLIKLGDAKIYSINFVATANGGNFIVYDLADAPTYSSLTLIKAEGSEATAANSKYMDFSDKPLEFGTGIYLSITTGYVTISYE